MGSERSVNARRFRRVAVAAATLMLATPAVASVAAAQVVPTQECAGTIDTTVTTPSLPGGELSVSDGCLNGDKFYEFSDGPVLAKAAMSTVTYDNGHTGRVAAGVLTLGNGVGLSILAVEDQSSGVVKWSAVLGEFNSQGDTVRVSGQGVAAFPIERATVSVAITGTGTPVDAPPAPEVPAGEADTPEADAPGGSANETPPVEDPTAGGSVSENPAETPTTQTPTTEDPPTPSVAPPSSDQPRSDQPQSNQPQSDQPSGAQAPAPGTGSGASGSTANGS